MKEFLEDRRGDELRNLDIVGEALAQNEHQTWLLTLVGKQDLWAGQERAVRQFYTTGTYGQRIEELKRKKGDRLFRHELVFGSLVIRNFATARGEQLQKNVAGYDHGKQVKSLRELIETLSRLLEWKAG